MAWACGAMRAAASMTCSKVGRAGVGSVIGGMTEYVSIAIGTNDVNGFSWRPATAADLDAMQARYELLIGEALAAGKTVVLPTLRWCTTNGYTAANLAAWNQRLWNVILPRYPTAIRGPDVYANSENHPEWLSDGTHPNELGRAATRQVWLDWAMANIYSAP